MTIYLIPENEQKLNCLYAVLSSDENGEGIVSAMSASGHMPLVFGHERMMNLMRPIIEGIAKDTGKKLLIVKYTNQEIIEEIGC